jgi:hypothetical protein
MLALGSYHDFRHQNESPANCSACSLHGGQKHTRPHSESERSEGRLSKSSLVRTGSVNKRPFADRTRLPRSLLQRRHVWSRSITRRCTMSRGTRANSWARKHRSSRRLRSGQERKYATSIKRPGSGRSKAAVCRFVDLMWSVETGLLRANGRLHDKARAEFALCVESFQIGK